MDTEKETVKVNIYGMEYAVKTGDDIEYLDGYAFSKAHPVFERECFSVAAVLLLSQCYLSCAVNLCWVNKCLFEIFRCAIN